MSSRSLWSFVLLTAMCGAARGAVVESSATGFQIRHTQLVAARPDKVWQSILTIDRWWSSAHTYSGKAANLRLEPRAGGCFCETLPNGGSVLHLTVVNVRPNQALVMSGALGPLQASGVAGAMTLDIRAEGTGSRLSMTYNVGGFQPGGLPTLAPIVDVVLAEQFARLTRLVETGNADAK